MPFLERSHVASDTNYRNAIGPAQRKAQPQMRFAQRIGKGSSSVHRLVLETTCTGPESIKTVSDTFSVA